MILGSGQTENTQIRVIAYFQFDHFPKSDTPKFVYDVVIKILNFFFYKFHFNFKEIYAIEQQSLKVGGQLDPQ